LYINGYYEKSDLFFVLLLVFVSCQKADPMQEVISKSFYVIEHQVVKIDECLDDKESRLPSLYVK
jgi:hypothetical protein